MYSKMYHCLATVKHSNQKHWIIQSPNPKPPPYFYTRKRKYLKIDSYYLNWFFIILALYNVSFWQWLFQVFLWASHCQRQYVGCGGTIQSREVWATERDEIAKIPRYLVMSMQVLTNQNNWTNTFYLRYNKLLKNLIYIWTALLRRSFQVLASLCLITYFWVTARHQVSASIYRN